MDMFRAIGFLIMLWGLSHFFNSAFSAFENAATATFKTVETAANTATVQMQNQIK